MAENPDAMARRFRRARASSGLTADQAADAAGCAKSSISRYENGKAEPGVHTAARLAKAYGVPLADLLGIEQPDEIELNGVRYVRRESSILTTGEREALQEPQQNRDEDRERS